MIYKQGIYDTVFIYFLIISAIPPFRLLHLRRKVEGQKEGHLSFLKTNVGAVMEQVDTLIALKEKYETDLSIYGSEPTLKLEKAIKGIEI